MKQIALTRFIQTKTIALACATTVLLSGCTTEFLVGDAITTIATDKTIGDHAISLVSGKDCSSVRRELGLTYCKEDDPQLAPQPKQYCYNELGKVTCYEQADLYSIRPGVEDKKEPIRKWR